jgi:hypothetical protein
MSSFNGDIESSSLLNEDVVSSSSSSSSVFWKNIRIFSIVTLFGLFSVCGVVMTVPGISIPFTSLKSTNNIDNPVAIVDGSYAVTRGMGHMQPDDGCVTMYNKQSVGLANEYTMVCLTGNERVQSLLFRQDELKMHKDISVVTGTDVFLTLYKNDNAVASVFSVTDKDLWEYTYDEIVLTFVRDHVYADQYQLMVELEGPVDVPGPCVLFSSASPQTKVFSSSFLICGRAGTEGTAMNAERFADIDVDITKLAIGFSHVSVGSLASVTMYSDSKMKRDDVSLQLEKSSHSDISKLHCLSSSSSQSKRKKSYWDTEMKAFQLVFE